MFSRFLRCATPLLCILLCPASLRATPGLVTLVSFDGTNGAAPLTGLTLFKGMLYGTTSAGGKFGQGTVFRLSPSGHLTTLYNFIGNGDGSTPMGTLFPANDGNLYGTTFYSVTNQGSAGGTGTVFKMTPSGVFSRVLTFPLASRNPTTGVIQGSDGFFYGTTTGPTFSGSLFDFWRDESTFGDLYDFGGGVLGYLFGARPNELLQGTDGKLYGTTFYAGGNFVGQFYSFDLDSWELKTLHSFEGYGFLYAGNPASLDGANPIGKLAQDSSGYFYGATTYGGANYLGTLFKIAPDGTPIWTISLGGTNRSQVLPNAGLTIGSDGKIYGTAGSIFTLTPDGELTTVCGFDADSGVGNPQSALTQTPDGALYGTSQTGGDYGLGTVFRYRQAPVVQTVLPAPGTVVSPSYRWFTLNTSFPTPGTQVTLTVEIVGPGLDRTWSPGTYRAGRPVTVSLAGLNLTEGRYAWRAKGTLLDGTESAWTDYQAFTVFGGVDLSRPASPAFFQKLRAKGYSFAIVDAWGGHKPFPQARTNLVNAFQAGLTNLGVYCLLNFDNGAKASADGSVIPNIQSGSWQVQQALFACGLRGTSPIPLAPAFMALDVEAAWAGTMIPSDRVSRVLEAANAVQLAGLRPVIYTRQDNGEWNALTGGSQAASVWPLWEANFNRQGLQGDDLNMDKTNPWTPFGGWTIRSGKQYLINGIFAGVQVDYDVFDPQAFGVSF